METLGTKGVDISPISDLFRFIHVCQTLTPSLSTTKDNTREDRYL